MKIAILCDSLTGNTLKLAKCIYDECEEYDVKFYRDYSSDFVNADLLFIGSYTKNMEPSEKIKKVYKSITDKKLFIFGTCGYNSSEEYYSEILKNTTSYVPGSNEIVDYFFCQGKMPYINRVTYEAKLKNDPKNKDLIYLIKNFDLALKHPNYSDLIDLQVKVKMLLNKLKDMDSVKK